MQEDRINRKSSNKDSIFKKLKVKDKRKERLERHYSEQASINVINKEEFEMVATSMQNLEEELALELKKIGAKEIQIQRRAVKFRGNLELLYKANIWLRTALKVLKPIHHFKIGSEEDLYQRSKKFSWEKIFSEDKTFSIDFAVHSDLFNHSQFAALRVKDAIVDRFRELQLNRPNVERDRPDVRIHLHINKDQVTLALDSSGEPLFKRGYRTEQHFAPINECLAAGMILKSGWKGENDFLDPMCGTGTIAIEAVLIACNIPPNMNRTHFAFEGWRSYDQKLLSDVLRSAKEAFTPLKVNVYARELNSDNIRKARLNISAANMRKSIQLEQANFFEAQAPSKEGTILMNPPYGERLSLKEETSLFFEKIGSTLKHNYAGWTAWIIASDIESFKGIGLKPSKKIPLMNGKLECQFRKYELFKGKRVERTNTNA